MHSTDRKRSGAGRRSRRPAPDRFAASVLVAHPGAELYGSDRVMLESVCGLLDAGIAVTVALPADGPLAPRLRACGATVTFVAMPVLRKSALRPRGLLRLALDLARTLRPMVGLIRGAGRDGVYVSTVTMPQWSVLGRLLGRRVVCHVHEAEASAPRVLRVAMAAPLWSASRVLVNSEFSLQVLAGSLPGLRRRSAVVYNAVPAPPAEVAARPGPVGGVRLLYVGRLSPRKGPDIAVAALAELVARGIDARLEVLGDVFTGYEWFARQLLEQVTQAGLADRVDFAGFDADVWPHLQAADIVLVPSVVDEPFGNTAVEAVLAARPLVVSATSGLREAAAGYRSAQFVPPGDAGAVADAVQTVLDAWPHYSALADEDSRLARRRHGIETYRARIVEALT